MRGKNKRNGKELEERLKALKKEQRRLAREINALSNGEVGPVKSSSSASNKNNSSSNRKSHAKSKPGKGSNSSKSGVEMKSYLSSGSFRGKSGLRHERAVQRNKAIFMLVLAGAALYIFFMWVY